MVTLQTHAVAPALDARPRPAPQTIPLFTNPPPDRKQSHPTEKW